MRRGPQFALLALVAIGGFGLAVVQLLYWVPHLDYLSDDHASGSWAALAVDAANGIFYRPLQSDVGYGGTRYMPLYFMLQSGLIRAGLKPLVAGHLLSVCAALGLVAGLYQLQRRLGVAARQALAFSLLPVCGLSFSTGLVRIAGDVLSLALEVWGLAACIGPGAPMAGRPVRRAALLFSLAVLTKATAFAALAAAGCWMWQRGEAREARRLLLSTLLGAAALVGAANWLSGGQLLESFAACAAAGATWQDVARAPMVFWGHLSDSSVVFLLLALAAVLADPQAARRDVAAIWLVASLAVTLGLFVSPGVNFNHLVMLDVAALMYLSREISSERIPANFGFAVVALAGTVGLVTVHHYHRPPDDVTLIDVAGEVAGDPEAPLLSENPWVPILEGERPYVLDPFNLRLVVRQRPEIARDLIERLDHRYFRAVVLERRIWPTVPPDSSGWYETMHFGPGFAEAVLRNYELVSEHRNVFIYRPKRF